MRDLTGDFIRPTLFMISKWFTYGFLFIIRWGHQFIFTNDKLDIHVNAIIQLLMYLYA